METDQPAGTVAPFRFGRRAIRTAQPRGRRRTASHSSEPLHGAHAAAGCQYFDGPDLVRTNESAVLDWSAAPAKTGSVLGGSAAHRRCADQPQSLRPLGSADAAAAGGSW